MAYSPGPSESALNQDERSAVGLLVDLMTNVSPRGRRELLTTFLLMTGGALAEMLTIAAVLPLLVLATNQTIADRSFALQLLRRLGGEQAPLLPTATILFAGAAVAAAILRLMVLRFSTRAAFGIGHEISIEIFRRMLNQPYSHYVGRNPSEIFAGLDKIQALIFSVILPLIQGITAAAIAMAIFTVLLTIAPGITVIAAGVVAGIYLIISRVTGSPLRDNSRVIATMANARMKALQEGHGGLRDILLDQAQEVFEARYQRIDAAFRRAQSNNHFLNNAPRPIVEACGILVIALVVFHLSGQEGGAMASIPALGAVAIAAQRLLPLLNNVYFSWSQLNGNRQILRDIIALLHMPTLRRLRKTSPFPFASDIVFDDVDLQYPSREPVLRNISLCIPKGSRVAIMGPTGSGKSSLLDLLMGMGEPTRGEIRIDGVRLDGDVRDRWQSALAHVPQSIYLADGSITANIAFGQADANIDMARVRASAETAQLKTFIDALPSGYATVVGDRGVRLSGGQRQRIGIARALYKQASVLVLDEPTGQLDRATEHDILTTIAALDEALTIILVTHQASALTGIDRVVHLDGGRLVPDCQRQPTK